MERDCEYQQKAAASQRPRTLSARTVEEVAVTSISPPITGPDVASLGLPAPSSGLSSSVSDAPQPWVTFNTDPPDTVLPDDSFFLDDSLFSFGDTLTPSFGP